MSYSSKNNLQRFNSSAQNNFRQSMDFLASQMFRTSVAFDNPPNINFRQSIQSPNKFRNSLNLQMARDFIQQMTRQNQKNHPSSFGKLKNTISELEVKLHNAKKQLFNPGNVLQQLNDDKSEEDFSISEMMESRIKPKKDNKLREMTSPNTYLGKKFQSNQSTKTHLTMGFQTIPIKIKTYYIQQLVRAMQGDNKEAYQHLNISLKVLKSSSNFEPPSFIQIQDRKINLPKIKEPHKKTLVIDIDQTIIHCQQDPNEPHDLVLPIKLQNGQYANAYIAIRPYAISFLKKMSKLYQIIAFTASHQSYADVVLDQIDPDRQYIKYRLYRDNCYEIHPNIYTKDLRIINRDLSQIVLIDNAPYSYIFQLQNGIPILPYYKGDDYQLPKLQKYLQLLAKSKDVRQINKETFQLYKYCKFQTPQQLAKQLYFKKN